MRELWNRLKLTRSRYKSFYNKLLNITVFVVFLLFVGNALNSSDLVAPERPMDLTWLDGLLDTLITALVALAEPGTNQLPATAETEDKEK